MARILVIDDDPGIRALLDQTLRDANHEVTSATDGREGIRQFLIQPADVVITDLYMPNQEGLETIMELRRRFPKVPIIAMSGNTEAQTMLSIANKLGAVKVLQKPFAIEEMLNAVEAALQLGAGAT